MAVIVYQTTTLRIAVSGELGKDIDVFLKNNSEYLLKTWIEQIKTGGIHCGKNIIYTEGIQTAKKKNHIILKQSI